LSGIANQWRVDPHYWLRASARQPQLCRRQSSGIRATMRLPSGKANEAFRPFRVLHLTIDYPLKDSEELESNVAVRLEDIRYEFNRARYVRTSGV
jgi:hypothetical protein